MKKITLLICLVIILNAPISAYAQATSTTPTVTIAAGSGAAVGGIYNNNGSKTAMAATALTLAVLSATGAAVKLTDASIQAGKTVYQVINDKFAQWVGGTSAEELSPSEAEELQSRFKVITGGGGNSEDPDNNQNNGTNIGEDGKLWFSPGSLAMLKKFTDFLESQDDGINVYEEPSASGNTDINVGGVGETLYGTSFKWHGWSSTTNVSTSAPCAFFRGQNARRLLVVSTTPFKFYTNGNQFGQGTLYKNYYGFWMEFGASNYLVSADPAILIVNTNSVNEIIDRITSWTPATPAGTIENDGIYANENWDNSLLNNPNNQSLVVDPGILPYINPTSDQQISIPDYLQLLIDQAQANATAQNQPINCPAIDPATLEVTPLEVPVIEQDPVTDPVPSEEVDPIETPDNPVQDPDEVPTPEDAVELMKVDLTRIFPFCIPWDLYRLIEKFNADPVTPSLTIDWGNIFGSLGVDFETTLDLHDYDSVASVLRTMETVAFVIGLAVATRSIFLQS